MDLRKPSGYFFGILGAIVALLGLLFPELQAPLSEGNVNLKCGIGIFLFGIMLLLLARRRRNSG